jgi:hypothetical protein
MLEREKWSEASEFCCCRPQLTGQVEDLPERDGSGVGNGVESGLIEFRGATELKAGENGNLKRPPIPSGEGD